MRNGTRILPVLIDEDNRPIAQGSHEWENQLADNLWTYSIDAIWFGVQDCYRDLRANVVEEYGVEIETLSAIGVSSVFLNSGIVVFLSITAISMPAISA